LNTARGKRHPRDDRPRNTTLKTTNEKGARGTILKRPRFGGIGRPGNGDELGREVAEGSKRDRKLKGGERGDAEEVLLY